MRYLNLFNCVKNERTMLDIISFGVGGSEKRRAPQSPLAKYHFLIFHLFYADVVFGSNGRQQYLAVTPPPVQFWFARHLSSETSCTGVQR